MLKGERSRIVTSMGDCSRNHGSDHAGGYRGKNVIAIDFAPFVSAGRTAKVIVPVVDPLTAIPILVANVFALSPFIMANVLLMVFVAMIAVVMMILRKCRTAN